MNRSFIILLFLFLTLFSGCQSVDQTENPPESTDPATAPDSSSENPEMTTSEPEDEPVAADAEQDPTEPAQRAETSPNYAEIPLGPNGIPGL